MFKNTFENVLREIYSFHLYMAILFELYCVLRFVKSLSVGMNLRTLAFLIGNL